MTKDSKKTRALILMRRRRFVIASAVAGISMTGCDDEPSVCLNIAEPTVCLKVSQPEDEDGDQDAGSKDAGSKDTDAKDTDAKDTDAKDTDAKDAGTTPGKAADNDDAGADPPPPPPKPKPKPKPPRPRVCLRYAPPKSKM